VNSGVGFAVLLDPMVLTFMAAVVIIPGQRVRIFAQR